MRSVRRSGRAWRAPARNSGISMSPITGLLPGRPVRYTEIRALPSLPPRRADYPPGRPRPRRRGIGRDPPPRPPRQGRLTASALGVGRSRRARAPHNRPRPRPLPRHPRATRHHRGKTDRRAQDRQTRLPRPPRARASRSLISWISIHALPFPPEPGESPPPLWNEPSLASPTRQPAPRFVARRDRHGLLPHRPSVQVAAPSCAPNHP
jgi:hypothetical protein